MNRLEKLFKVLPAETECVLISSDINRRYFSGMKSSAGYILAFREKGYLLIDFRYYEKAVCTVSSCDVVLMKSFKNQALELLRKHGVKKISIESDTVTVSQLDSYKNVFEGFEIDFSHNLSKAISSLRAVKSEDEIKKITAAQRIAERAFENILNFIRPGISEKEISLELDFYMLKNGAEALSFDTIALTGKNTSLPHGIPSDDTVKNGSLVLMDFGAVYDGYHSDMTRTVCVGEPDFEMREIYALVLSAQNSALEFAKEGIKGCELDKIARDIIAKNGYGDYFGHSLGHGVGLEIHEFPNASVASEAVFAKNMVVTVEPGIYIPGKFGVRIEDFVVIKEDFAENLTKCPKNLICL
ncbi:MAG: aminopeptidase P family protein [Oscillospiraceae bacterium]|jgi:Xaa-Pro aminopeptidase